MARRTQAAVFSAGVICLLSLAGTAYSAAPQFFVEGEVFCEVCRVNFINKYSEVMPGAKVRLECKGDGVGNVTYSAEGETNEAGVYKLPVEGDHEEEDCQVTLVKSSRADCAELPDDGWAKQPSSKVTLTTNSGMHDQIRPTNPLAFTKKEALPQCADLIRELQTDNDIN